MSNRVQLTYMCRSCNTAFVETGKAPLPENPLCLMQAVGLARHPCADGKTGIGELESYEAEPSADGEASDEC